MKRIFLLLGALAAASCVASGTVVTFDDLSGGFGPVPANYAGISWDSQWNYWVGSSPTFVPISAPNLAYFNTTNDGGFDFSSPVVFNGAYFDGNGTDTLKFLLFLGGNPVATSSSLQANSGAMVFLNSGYSGLVDRVEVDITGPLNGWTLDNVTYNAVSTPEPGSLGLLAVGAGGLAILRRRKIA